MNRFKVNCIYEKDGKTIKESYKFIFNKEIIILNLNLDENLCFYESDELTRTVPFVRTTAVKRINESDFQIKVFTENSIYVFDKL
jgi:hypothetical protein